MTLIGSIPSLLTPQDTLGLETRNKSKIENFLNRQKPLPGQFLEVQDHKKKRLSCVHRTDKPCPKYNCHGLTFASRRTAIIKSATVQMILTEDGYQPVSQRMIMAGDVVIYRAGADSGAEIEHSGIVVDVGDKTISQIMVLSKWGFAHEVIHSVPDCPYEPFVEFYRVMP